MESCVPMCGSEAKYGPSLWSQYVEREVVQKRLSPLLYRGCVPHFFTEVSYLVVFRGDGCQEHEKGASYFTKSVELSMQIRDMLLTQGIVPHAYRYEEGVYIWIRGTQDIKALCQITNEECPRYFSTRPDYRLSAWISDGILFRRFSEVEIYDPDCVEVVDITVDDKQSAFCTNVSNDPQL